MEEVTEHAVGAGVEGMLEVLAGRRTESKPTMGLDIIEKVKPVDSEKSGLVGASYKSSSDPHTTDIFEGAHEELVNPEAQPLREVLGEGFAQGSELSSRLESVYMTANVEFDLEKISTLLQHVPVNPKSVQGDRSILSIPPSSSPADLNQELITEVLSAVEEMTCAASIGGGVPPGESHALFVPSHLRIDPGDIIEVREIGNGASAKVYEAICSGRRCAVKRFESEYSRELVSAVQKELDFLIEFRHPHIVTLMGLSVDSQQRCSIVMELMSASLRALIESRMQERRSIETKENHISTPIVPFTLPEALEVITQIARGMSYLHFKGVSHRDLKSANVLVQNLGHGFFEVKIVDFGASLNIESSGMRIGVGTGFWRAPEILPTKTVDRLSKPDLEAADVYSFAMTCYEVLTGQIPFQGQLRACEYDKVIAGLRPKLPKDLNSGLKALIKSCWNSDPNKRPVFRNICRVLDDMTSSMLDTINKASVFDKLWNASRQTPGMRDGVHDRAQLVEASPAQSSTWGSNMEKGSGRLDGANADAIKTPEAIDLKAVEKVVWQRSQPPGDILPNFLKIDISQISIKDPLHKLEMLNKRDSRDCPGWAAVCEGSWLGCKFAVKVFKSPESDWNKSQLLKEVGSLMELRHPHIIRFIGFAQDAQLSCILMELMPERDLRHFMKKLLAGRPFTRSQILDIITQIAKGMLYLHTQGYVHGDLKCSNVLVKKYDDYIEVKIGDLRNAQKLESAGGSSEINLVRRPRWTPLEALDNYGGAKPSDDLLKQADVYNFAMTCYEVVTGKLPYQDVRDVALREQIKAGVRPELPGDLQHSGLKGLIESCWDNNPNERPVFENICVILDFIRYTMRAVTNKSSEIANVWNAFKQIPNDQEVLSGWLGGVRDRAQPVETSPAQSTTWASNMGNGSGRPELVAFADAIKIPECLKIRPATLKRVRKIGSGSSAKVYEAIWLGCTCAVKRIKKFENPELISALQRELDFLIQLRHPYIIQLLGFSIDEQERCSIVMEYMNGSLRDVINSRIQTTATKTNSSQPVLLFEFQEAVGIITQIALGMAFLHSRGVTHRDLKAPNVLCQEHAGFMGVKIVDFGVSQYIADASGATTLGVGTGFWRAPEIFPTAVNRSRERSVNLMAADVYSFAMTCYEILTGFAPFDEYGFRISQFEVVEGLRPTLPPGLDAGLKKLITDCWHTDPEQRPNFVEICRTLSHS